MIKDAGRLLYCDGLASSRLVGERGGGKRKPLSLADFVHLKHHRTQRPSSCERTCQLCVLLSVSASISRSSPHCFNELTEPQLLGVLYDSIGVYEHTAQAGMPGPVEFCSMTEHLKTPISPRYSSSSAAFSGSLIYAHTHTHMHELKHLCSYESPLISLLNTHIGRGL